MFKTMKLPWIVGVLDGMPVSEVKVFAEQSRGESLYVDDVSPMVVPLIDELIANFPLAKIPPSCDCYVLLSNYGPLANDIKRAIVQNYCKALLGLIRLP